jgi:hypothetical protein
MLEKFGYIRGTGLGPTKTGIKTPLTTSYLVLSTERNLIFVRQETQQLVLVT